MNLDTIKHPIKTFKAGQTRKGNNLALDHTARAMNRYLVEKAGLKDAPVKNSLKGAAVGALLGGTGSALTHEVKVRMLAKKIRKSDPSISYADSMKQAREILGSFKQKLKQGAVTGGLVGAVAGGAATAGLRYKKYKDKEEGKRGLYVEKRKEAKQLDKEAKYISKKADDEHRRKLADAQARLANVRSALAQQRIKDNERDARKKVYQNKWDNLLDKLSQSKEQRANAGYKDRTLFDRDLRKKDQNEE